MKLIDVTLWTRSDLDNNKIESLGERPINVRAELL